MEGRRIGRFLVERPLKAGGMGAIFAARDVVLDRVVALKVLPASAEADGERRAWLLREARAAASISHPNVATVFEAGHDGGTVYLAMELVAGEDLATRLARGPVSLDELRHIGLGIAAGLTAAHAVGVLHRDLKPANVMLTEGGVPKLVDFGLARPAQRDDLKSLTGRIGGTPGYMPPEQIRGEAADPRTDLFALGVVLFEAWTGTAPFGIDGMAALVRTVEGDRPSVASLRETSAPLAQLLDRLLAPARAARPESAREASAVLEALGGAERFVVRAVGVPRLTEVRPATDPHAATVPPAALASTVPPAPSGAPDSRPSSAALLVGRTEAVERVVDVLRHFSRLVTVTGPPGIGKTAVANEAVGRLRTRGERVLVVPLGGASDVDGALAAVLGAGRSIDAALAAETGVVHFDGGEHLLAELAERLERWLSASPARFLVSGGTRVDLPDEHVVELGPLDPEAAAELFLARARRARPALADGDDVRAAARAVALALGGHPLALVLAAARAALLSPAEIAARAAAAPLALVGEAAARSPGLRQAVAPPLGRLAPDDAALLHGLSLFEEPFDAAAGEAMARALAPRTDALAALDRLHRASLLRSTESEDGVRLAIDRVVREVLRERLEERGLARAASDAFVAWGVALARDGVLDPGRGRALVHEFAGSLGRAEALAAPGDRATLWITALEAFQRPRPEHEARLERALSEGGLSAELVCALELALVSRRMDHDVVAAAALARQARDHALGLGVPFVALARALSVDALLRAHRHDEAAVEAEAMLAAARSHGRPGDEVDALERLATLSWRRARHDEGLAHLRRALELAEALRDRGRQAVVLLACGILLVQERRFSEARGLYERAGALARAVHMHRLGAVLANNLGVILHEENDLAGAEAAFSETHALALRTGRPLLSAIGRLNRGMLLHERGELDGARADLDAAIAGATALGETRYRIIALGARAAVRADQADERGAQDDLAAASALLGASPELQLALALSVRSAHVELALATDPARRAAAERTVAAFRAERAEPMSALSRSENARMAMRQLDARHSA